MKLFKYIFTLIIIAFTTNAIHGQVYPVQVTVATTPPYYNYLSHYGDQNNHLLIVATLTDFNSPPVNVRLRVSIEGAGYKVQTRSDIPVGNVYTLSPGVPVFIQGDEILPYLSEQNLAVVSGSPNLNNLPEGLTTFCVSVVENGTGGAILANDICTSFLLQLMQPPQPFLPMCNSVVDTALMFQTFQWSQPQNYIPSIGTDLNYTFSLYEWIDTTNYNIFQTGQGLVYSAQTTVPLIQVSNFDVTFQKGRKYVWRVKAQITSNGVPTQMITQGGISQPCSFYYGKPATIEEALSDGLTINLSTQALTTRKGQATWTVTDETPGQGLSTYSSYIVEYRKKASEGSSIIYPWSVDTVATLMLPIYQLEPEQTYEVRVAGQSGNYTSERTPISEFTTPAAREYACGEADFPFTPSNYQPLEVAHMGDVVQIGQFPMYITQATPLGTPGRFSGYGEIAHDFIGGAKVKVSFNNILIDREYVVREGVANAMTEGAEGWMNNYYLDHAFRDTVGTVTAYGYSGDSTSVFVVVDGDTLSYTFNLPYPIVIYGEGNVAYQFWPDGTVVITTWGTAPSNDQLDATKNFYAEFRPMEGSEQLFDKKQYDHFASNYEVISCAENFNYWVPNTAKGTSGTTQVKATVHANTQGYLASNISFEIKGGYTTVPHTQVNDTTFILTLPAKSFNYQVYAKYEEFKIGKLNVMSYDSVTRKLRIVPLVAMGNVSASTIAQGLSNQFKASRIGFSVVVDNQFSSAEFGSQTVFSNPDANLMQKYTAQMSALRSAYLNDNELENDEYLIFVIPGFENSDIDGYMVRGKALGFISQSALSNTTKFISTLAHELGHGMGGLEHAWGSDQSKQGTTNNLMDYSSSSLKTLTRNQWDAIHDAPFTLSLFDDDEDFALVSSTLGNSAILANLSNSGSVSSNLFDDTYIFKNSKDVLFRFTTSQILRINTVYFDNGSVIGFMDHNNHYYRLYYHLKKDLVDAANNVYLVSDKGTITFAGSHLPRDSVQFTDTDGQQRTSYSAIDDDMLIGKDQYVECADSLKYVYNGQNSAPLRRGVECNESNLDCDSYSSEILTNPGASASFINRSSKSCIQLLSDQTLNAFIDVFREDIDNITQGTNYNYVNYQNIGSGFSSNCFGGHSCADEFDVGMAFVSIFDACQQRQAVIDHIAQIIKQDNYAFLRKVLVKFDFRSVGYPLVDLATNVFSDRTENFIHRSTPMKLFGETVQVPNEFKTYIITYDNHTTFNSTNALDAQVSGISGETIFLSDQGHVVLNENYNYTRVYQEIDNRFVVSNSNTYENPGALLFSQTHVIDTFEVFSNETRDPFQPTLFVFNEQFNPIAIEQDKHYLRPAIWGIIAKKLIEDSENDEYWRTFGNACTVGAAVIAAPFTGGGSLAILAGGATVATVDQMFITLQNNQSLGEYQADSTTRYYWNQFYTAMQMIDGIVGGGQLAVLGGNGIVRLMNSIDDVTELIQDIGFVQYVSRSGKAIYTTFIAVCKTGVTNVQDLFTVGEQIAGKTIVHVRSGNSNKIAVIGRQMNNHVNTVAEYLQTEGKTVEILDDNYLNRSFNIDGQEWTVSQAWDDMVKNPAYDYMKDPLTNFITAEYIEQIPMYKLNKQWVEQIKAQGYTIIDIGYPQGLTSESLFYNMELSTLNW